MLAIMMAGVLMMSWATEARYLLVDVEDEAEAMPGPRGNNRRLNFEVTEHTRTSG